MIAIKINVPIVVQIINNCLATLLHTISFYCRDNASISLTPLLHLVVRACISIHFSPITRINIAVSYIIYIYYNKEKEALKVWENI